MKIEKNTERGSSHTRAALTNSCAANASRASAVPAPRLQSMDKRVRDLDPVHRPHETRAGHSVTDDDLVQTRRCPARIAHEAPNPMAISLQPLGERTAVTAGRPGNQNLHCVSSSGGAYKHEFEAITFFFESQDIML